MKIAVLQDDFPPHHAGGSGVIAYQLAKAFAADGHDVLVITTVQDRAQVGRERSENMDIVRLFSSYHPRYRAYLSTWNPRMTRAVQRLLHEFAPDIVHVHNVHHYLSYRSIAVARRYAHVYMTAHDAMSFHFGKYTRKDKFSSWKELREHKWRYNPFRNAIIRHILRKNVTTIIAVSSALQGALIDNGINASVVVHNGISVEEWVRPEGVEPFKKKFSVADSAILFGGRLSGAKGAAKMVEALPMIRDAVPEAQLLVIAKRDAYAGKMLALAERLGIAERIVFTGWLSGRELRQAYYASSVVAVPSLYLDPFPTVNLEALACRKPVVATCFGGSPEIIQDGINGYVVDPFDVAAMASRISDLLVNKDKNSRFGQSGYERVAKEFTLERQVTEYAHLFGIKSNSVSADLG